MKPTSSARTGKSKGQALVMVTLALVAMCGLMGLAVDLGWSFFVRRAAQRAADTAALGAAQAVLRSVSGTTFTCGGMVGCQSATPCSASPATPPATSVDVACLYAKQNGFYTGGNNSRQTVRVEGAITAAGCSTASPPTCIPTAPGVAAFYYVTVTVVETVPQLFSSVLGNPVATVSARATGAVIDSVFIGSLILLNRENDASPVTGRGVNLAAQGGSDIQVPGGILMASKCNGTNCDGRYAGTLQGGPTLTSPFTFIREVGKVCAGNLGCTSQSTWTAPPTNRADSRMFRDPTEGKGQPPLSTQPGPGHPYSTSIPGGTAANPTVLPPGNYYMTATDRNGNVVATGQPITLGAGHFTFGSCGSSFDQWVFFGGLRTASGNAVVKFTPGRYVFAGQNSGEGDPLFEISNGTILQDCTTGGGLNTDMGEIFIFTDANYEGLNIQVANAGPVAAIRDTLLFGTSGIKTGNNDNSSITLHGLNDLNSSLPTELKDFSPFVFWQDRRNSRVKYTSDGRYDTTSCGSAGINNPCTNSPEEDLSREMFLRATPNVLIYGAAYQPRGAWLTLQAGGNYTGPLQVVTGAVKLQGSPPLNLSSISNPITYTAAALVE